jgi:hypothetical protein
MRRLRFFILGAALALAACAKPPVTGDLMELPPIPPTRSADPLAANAAPAAIAPSETVQTQPETIDRGPPAPFLEAPAPRDGEWIAQATTYHADELPDAVPETVFALVRSARGTAVVRAKLEVKPVLPEGAETMPEDADRQAQVFDPATGQALDAQLIMHVAGVKPGPQPALSLTPQATPDPGDRVTVRVQMGGETLFVRLRDAPIVPNAPDCVILVEYKGVRQVVQDNQCTFDTEPRPLTAEELAQLFWFGDIDRDGRPDVIYKPLGHYNAMETELWLSSRARPGRLFALAARMHAVGC